MSDFVHNKSVNKAIYKKLQSMGLFKSSEAQRKTGISQSTLSRWASKGIIKRVDRGLYMHPQSSIPPELLDFAIACTHFGNQSAVGGVSALFYYGLIEQVPQQVWLIVPSSRKNERIQKKYKCLRIHTTLKIGIDKQKHFKITNIERTLIEAMKFGTKIGQRTAISSARKALREGLTNEKKLLQMASCLKIKNILEKYWEAIVA